MWPNGWCSFCSVIIWYGLVVFVCSYLWCRNMLVCVSELRYSTSQVRRLLSAQLLAMQVFLSHTHTQTISRLLSNVNFLPLWRPSVIPLIFVVAACNQLAFADQSVCVCLCRQQWAHLQGPAEHCGAAKTELSPTQRAWTQTNKHANKQTTTPLLPEFSLASPSLQQGPTQSHSHSNPACSHYYTVHLLSACVCQEEKSSR